MVTVGGVGHALTEVLPRVVLQLSPEVIYVELGLSVYARMVNTSDFGLEIIVPFSVLNEYSDRRCGMGSRNFPVPREASG